MANPIQKGNLVFNPDTKQWEEVAGDALESRMTDEDKMMAELNRRQNPNYNPETQKVETPTPQQTPATTDAAAQTPATPEATPAAQTPATSGSVNPLIELKRQADAAASKGTYTNRVALDRSQSSHIKTTDTEKAIPQAQAQAKDWLNNNNLSRAFLDRFVPQPEPLSPEDAIKREKYKRSALLLADTLRTLMGGVAMENNASVPAIEHDGIKTIDENIKRLSDDYAKQVQLKRKREDEANKYAAELAKTDNDNALDVYKKVLDANETDVQSQSSIKDSAGYSQYRVPSSNGGGRSGSGSGSKKDVNDVYMKIANKDYNDLTKDEKKDFVNIAKNYALSSEAANTSIRKVLQRAYNKYKEENAAGRTTDKSDITGQKSNTDNSWKSFDDWVRSEPTAEAILIKEIENNYDDLPGFSQLLKDRLVATGRYDYMTDNWDPQTSKRPYYEPPVQAPPTRKSFEDGVQWMVRDLDGNMVELEEGMPFIDGSGELKMIHHGVIVPYIAYNNF